MQNNEQICIEEKQKNLQKNLLLKVHLQLIWSSVAFRRVV